MIPVPTTTKRAPIHASEGGRSFVTSQIMGSIRTGEVEPKVNVTSTRMTVFEGAARISSDERGQ